MDEGDVLDLTVETVDEFEFSFSATVCLTLSVDILRNFLFENLWWLGVFQNLVLAERKKSFEEILGDRETDNELFPREERPVEETREAL